MDIKKDGQNKCPSCGATEISPNLKTGKLICQFCHYEFKNEYQDDFDFSDMQGEIISKGFHDIDENSEHIITLKCESCGSEVVIDTTEALQARCHWCRNILSLNNQVPNGAVPDVILPFAMDKEEAISITKAYVKKRRLFAKKIFKQEFQPESITGVYMPYAIVDADLHAKYSGNGEIETARYKVNDNKRYDYESYIVEREFDLEIQGLTVETSSKRIKDNANETNNVINAIMPFDIENAKKFDANYMKGFHSEKRDLNYNNINKIVDVQLKDIARYKAKDTVKDYDRGVYWGAEQIDIRSKYVRTAYLPVWLYSYLEKIEKEGEKEQHTMHYVAINARTKETVGSVPINALLLAFVTLCIGIMFFWGAKQIFTDKDLFCTLVPLGISVFCSLLFSALVYSRYRNGDKMHSHEKETSAQMSNLESEDYFVEKVKGVSREKLESANMDYVEYQYDTYDKD